ncbi:MAG: Hsp70 family protein, partial [Candidatus Hinthialibacter sp.]
MDSSVSFLKESVQQDEANPASRFVVTVTASFQAAQRLDTMKAAELAGISLTGGDLMDEPIAAFFDYLMSHAQNFSPKLERPKNLLVFDFGGGTCDVAVFRLQLDAIRKNISISPLAVSRYHRLGGGDIDRAILYEVLVPQIIEQNGLSSSDLTYD